MAYNYEMQIVLSNFLDARVMEAEDSEGCMEKGIFIPLDKNALSLSSRNKVCAYAFVNEKVNIRPDDSYDYYIKQKTNSNHVKKLNSLGYQTPFLGGMRRQNKYFPKFQKQQINNNKVKREDYGM